MRKNGYTAQVVEKWIPHVNQRKDLFDIIDIVAIRKGEVGVLGIQSTSAENVAARITKAMLCPHLPLWKETGNKFVVHGWGKRGARGERKLWTLIERPL